MSLDAILGLLFVLVFVVVPVVSRLLRARNRRSTGPTGPGDAASSGGAGERGPVGGPTSQPDEAEVPAWLKEAQRRVREARARTTAEASTSAGREAAEQGGGDGPRGLFRTAGPPASEEATPAADGATSERSGRLLVPEDPFEGGLTEPREERRAGSGLGREGAPPEPAPAPELAEPGRESPPAAAEAAPAMGSVGVEPRRRRRGRRSRAEALLEAEAEVLIDALAAYTRPPGGTGGARLDVVGLLRFDREAIVSGLIWHEILDEPAWKRRRGRLPSRPRSR